MSAETIMVRIREVEGTPVRDVVSFHTGDLVPGEVLEVPKWQGDLEIAKSTVVPAEAAAPEPKPKRTTKKKAGTGEGSPDFLK